MRILVFLGLALALTATAAHAGKGRQEGLIEGTVLTPKGEPAAGARVTIRSDALVRGQASTTTGDDGMYRFVDLAPGNYDIDVELTGVGIAVDAVDVHIGERVTLDFILVAAADETTVTAAEETPVDESGASLSYVLEDDFFEELPMDRRSFQGLLLTFPGVLRGPSEFSVIRGGSWLDSQILIDGVNYSDPITNSILMRFDFHSIAEVEILSGGLAAEYGQALSGVVNMVTKSGGAEHTAGVFASVSPPFLSASEGDGEAGSIYEVNAHAGGPVVPKLLHYFTSLTFLHDFLAFPQPEGLDVAPGRTIDAVMGFGKLQYEPAEGHRIVLHLSGYFENRENDRTTEIVLQEAQNDDDLGGMTSQLGWKSIPDDGDTLVEASVGAYWYEFNITPDSEDLETPGQVDFSTGIRSGNGTDLNYNRSLRAQLQTAVTHFFSFAGEHEAKLGADFAVMRVTYGVGSPGNEVLENMGGPCDPENGVFDGCYLSRRVGTEDAEGNLVPGAFLSKPSGTLFGAFAQDVWKLNDHVTVLPGWRIDMGRVKNSAGDTVAALDGFLGPRLGMAWNVRGDGNTVIRLQAGRAYQTSLLALPLFFGPSVRREVYAFNPQTRQFDIFQGQNSSGGDTGAVIDLEQSKTPPHADELFLGADQVLPGGLVMQLSGILRRASHLYNSVETNLVWNEAGDAIVGFRDGVPRPQYTLRTSSAYFREYAAAEVAIRGKFLETGSVLAAYTLSRLYGTSELDEVTEATNIVPLVAANPRQKPFLYGPLQSDRRHVVKVSVAYTFPKQNLSVGSTFTAASGAPYSRLYYSTFLGGYYDRKAPRGTDPRDLNDPDDDRKLRTDALIEWNAYAAWRLDRWPSLEGFSVETQIFNLLSRRSAVLVDQRNVDQVGDTGFGTPVQVTPPFRVSLAIRYDY